MSSSLLLGPLLEGQRAGALDNFSEGVKYEFAQGNLGFRDAGDAAVVLAEIVTHLDLVEQAVGLQQRMRPLLPRTTLPTIVSASSG